MAMAFPMQAFGVHYHIRKQKNVENYIILQDESDKKSKNQVCQQVHHGRRLFMPKFTALIRIKQRIDNPGNSLLEL